MGYNVKAFCYQDSPRRAHSIAAQGGINAAKNYQNDGDSIFDYSMIQSKVVIIELVKQTFTV
jgi:succinate dehydrogenase/fumarate reductase flavoprotein subunit